MSRAAKGRGAGKAERRGAWKDPVLLRWYPLRDAAATLGGLYRRARKQLERHVTRAKDGGSRRAWLPFAGGSLRIVGGFSFRRRCVDALRRSERDDMADDRDISVAQTGRSCSGSPWKSHALTLANAKKIRTDKSQGCHEFGTDNRRAPRALSCEAQIQTQRAARKSSIGRLVTELSSAGTLLHVSAPAFRKSR